MYSGADEIINLFTFFHSLPSSHFQGDTITFGQSFQGNHYIPKSQSHSSASCEGAQAAKSDRYQEDGQA
jgi:hypothetical protein